MIHLRLSSDGNLQDNRKDCRSCCLPHRASCMQTCMSSCYWWTIHFVECLFLSVPGVFHWGQFVHIVVFLRLLYLFLVVLFWLSVVNTSASDWLHDFVSEVTGWLRRMLTGMFLLTDSLTATVQVKWPPHKQFLWVNYGQVVCLSIRFAFLLHCIWFVSSVSAVHWL